MSSSYNYNPIPPRVWSRVQNPCTFVTPNNSSNSVYIPLKNTTPIVTQSNTNLLVKFSTLKNMTFM